MAAVDGVAPRSLGRRGGRREGASTARATPARVSSRSASRVRRDERSSWPPRAVRPPVQHGCPATRRRASAAATSGTAPDARGGRRRGCAHGGHAGVLALDPASVRARHEGAHARRAERGVGAFGHEVEHRGNSRRRARARSQRATARTETRATGESPIRMRGVRACTVTPSGASSSRAIALIVPPSDPALELGHHLAHHRADGRRRRRRSLLARPRGSLRDRPTAGGTARAASPRRAPCPRVPAACRPRTSRPIRGAA